MSGLQLSPLVLGWVIASLLRIAVGSATVAVVTAASIMVPIAAAAPHVNRELLVVSIGAGSLIASHVNDGGFWLVKEYLNMTVPQTFATWTVIETIVSIAGSAGSGAERDRWMSALRVVPGCQGAKVPGVQGVTVASTFRRKCRVAKRARVPGAVPQLPASGDATCGMPGCRLRAGNLRYCGLVTGTGSERSQAGRSDLQISPSPRSSISR